MTRHTAIGRSVALAASLGLVAAAAPAQNVPIAPWSAPTRWTPPAPSGVRRLANDIGNPIPLVPITPCRIADTRGNGFSGQAGPPALANTGRTFAVTGTVTTIPTQCGIPAGARAASFNFTVINMTSNGNLVAWPAGGVQPNTSVLNWSASSGVVGNGGVVAISAGGNLRVLANTPASASVDLIIDVNGYYTDAINDNESLTINGSFSNGGMLVGRNSAPFGHGVEGFALSSGYGVYGQTQGTDGSSAGVYGTSSTGGVGVYADSTHDALVVLGGHNGAVLQGLHDGVTGTDGLGLPPGTDTLDSGGVIGGSVDHTGVIGVSRLNHGGVAGSFHKLDDQSPYGNTTHVTLCPNGTAAANFFGNVNINAGTQVGSNGNLSVNGTLSKGGGSFKIDHPLDPENKYLYHSFVESPDMKNVYDGTAVLDARGEATIALPDYFEALNSDFRYQLTSIGRFSPVYVAEEIENNRFRIAGGRPGAKVSWQVTGIRQDAFAKAHRIQVEIEKEPELKGTYLHPAELGKPADRASALVEEKTERQREISAKHE